MVKAIHSGELNYQVEVFKKAYSKNSVGESETNLVSIGKRFVKRSESTPSSDDDDGRVRSENTASFIFRYEPMFFTNGTNLVIRDFTGDFEVAGIELVGYGRKRFVELKGHRRG